MARVTFFTHFCHCSVKTELIYRNNCAKNSFNRSRIGAFVYRQFSTTFALEHSSGQWTRGSEDWVCAFCKCQHHLLCNSVPFSLWTVFTNRVPLFLWSRSEEWPLSCSKSLCIERDELSILLAFFFVVFTPTRDVVEHRHEDTLVIFGLLTGSPYRGAPRGEHLPIRVRSYKGPAPRTHPLPATPLQCPRSRTATLGQVAAAHLPTLTLAWLYIEPSSCGGVRPAGDPVDSDPGAVFFLKTIPTLDRTLVAR